MFRIIALLVAISLITGTGYAQPGKAYKCPNVNGHERQVITSVELSLGASLPITYANAGFRLGDAYQVLRKPGIVVGTRYRQVTTGSLGYNICLELMQTSMGLTHKKEAFRTSAKDALSANGVLPKISFGLNYNARSKVFFDLEVFVGRNFFTGTSIVSSLSGIGNGGNSLNASWSVTRRNHWQYGPLVRVSYAITQRVQVAFQSTIDLASSMRIEGNVETISGTGKVIKDMGQLNPSYAHIAALVCYRPFIKRKV